MGNSASDKASKKVSPLMQFGKHILWRKRDLGEPLIRSTIRHFQVSHYFSDLRVIDPNEPRRSRWPHNSNPRFASHRSEPVWTSAAKVLPWRVFISGHRQLSLFVVISEAFPPGYATPINPVE